MKLNKINACITSALSIVFLLQACNDIPYDKQNARKHFISLKEAASLTSTFRRAKFDLNRQLADTNYLDKTFNLPNGELFNRDAIAALMNQKGVKGVRIYLGRDKKGLVKMVLVATDENGDDMAGHFDQPRNRDMDAEGTSETGGTPPIILEAGQRCPTMCSKTSPLN